MVSVSCELSTIGDTPISLPLRIGGGCLVERIVLNIWTVYFSSKLSNNGAEFSVVGSVCGGNKRGGKGKKLVMC